MAVHVHVKVACPFTKTEIHTNVEIACLAAPRPMLLVSDGGDWTKNNPRVEFPFALRIYKLYGRESAFENVHLEKEVYDYGINKRLADGKVAKGLFP